MSTLSCECGACAKPAMEEPLVCSLSGHDLVARAHAFRAVFAHLVVTRPFDGGIRWHFRREPGLDAALDDLVKRERECCRFLQFSITRDGDRIVWETRASKEAATVLDAFMRLPETLERDPNLSAIKRAGEPRGQPR